MRLTVARAVSDEQLPKRIMGYWLCRLPQAQPGRFFEYRLTDDGLPEELRGEDGAVRRVELAEEVEIRTRTGHKTPHYYRVGWDDETRVVVVGGPVRRRKKSRA